MLRFFSSSVRTTFVASLKFNPNLPKIYWHSFNRKLFNGTLSPQIFGRYLVDDEYYLNKYAVVLLNVSAKASPTNSVLEQKLTNLATSIIDGELEMHKEYEPYFELATKREPGPTITKYVKFLQLIEEKELPIALCGILPCFLIYKELGKIAPKNLETNRYKNWVEAYRADDFVAATDALIEEIDNLAKSHPNLHPQMKEAFDIAVQSEMAFFDEVCLTDEPQCDDEETSAPSLSRLG